MARFDRIEDLSQLYDRVMLRTPVLVQAPDGMGKTFLLHQLIEKLQGRRVCFYISLRGYTSFSQFLQDWVQEFIRVSAHHSNLQYQLKRFLDEYGVQKLEHQGEIAQWCQSLTQMLGQVALDFLFLFDDLDEWEVETSPEGLFELFGILSQTRNIQLLFSVNPSLADQPPIANLELYKLRGLQQEDIWPQGASPEEQKAYEYSDGHSGMLLHILHYMQDSPEAGKAANRLMQELLPRFKLFKNRFTGLQWNLLRAIALEEKVAQPHAFDFLVKYRLGAASSVERALRNLIDSGMISRSEEGWQLTHVVHKRWLQWLYSSSFN